MNYKHYALVGGLLLASFSIGRFMTPAKVETKEVERVVYRESEQTNKNQNVVETVKETHLPDGTVVKETRKEKETVTQTEKQRAGESDRLSSTKTEARPSFRIGLAYIPAVRGYQEQGYSGTIETRLFSELYTGISMNNQGQLGFTISLGF